MENQGYGDIGNFDYDRNYEYNFGYHQNELRKDRQDRQLQDFQSKLINSSPWTSEEALKKGLEKNVNEMGQSFGKKSENEIEKLEKDNEELFKIYNNARDELDDETKKAEFDKNIQKLKDIEKQKYDEYTKLFNSFKGFTPSNRSKFTEKIKDAENIFLQSKEKLQNLKKESNRAHNIFLQSGFAIRRNQSIIEQKRRDIDRRYRNLQDYYERMMNNITKSKKRKKERKLAKRVMKKLKSKLGGKTKKKRRRKTKKKRRRRKSTKKKRRRKTKKRRRKRRGGGLEWFNKCITNLKTNVEKLLTKYKQIKDHQTGEEWSEWDRYGPNSSFMAYNLLPMFDYILSEDENVHYVQPNDEFQLFSEIRRLVKCVVNKTKTKPEAYDPIVESMGTEQEGSFDMKNPEHVVIVLVGRGGQLMKKW